MVGPSTTTVKFLCSYGGKILPRYPDGKLRYHGGHTRVLSVDRSVSFAELMVKLGELCGSSVSLRCQLPSEDLDALVSITSDEDLANLIEEYDKAAASSATSSSLKIRAFLSPPKSVKKVSPPPSVSSPTSSTSSPFSSVTYSGSSFSSKSSRCPAPMANRCYRSRITAATPLAPYHPACHEKSSGRISPPYGYHQGPGNPAASGGHVYLVHNGNHWQ
uniref:PB1 domain-containing protein n=1 Tax=Kalanchoe fedtschenkoi TaxID=63787 RepID=A0A7N1A7Y7_KALFE